MNVSVRHFHSEHADSHTLARHGGLDGDRHLAGKRPQPFVGLLVQMEDVVILNVLRNDKSMPFRKRAYVQKGVELIVLGHLE